MRKPKSVVDTETISDDDSSDNASIIHPAHTPVTPVVSEAGERKKRIRKKKVVEKE